MKFANLLSAGLVLASLAACAPKPDSIAPAAIPLTAYKASSCASIPQAVADERAILASLSRDQNNARTAQGASIVLGGVIGMAFTVGLNKEAEIAASKGRLAALEARQREC